MVLASAGMWHFCFPSDSGVSCYLLIYSFVYYFIASRRLADDRVLPTSTTSFQSYDEVSAFKRKVTQIKTKRCGEILCGGREPFGDILGSVRPDLFPSLLLFFITSVGLLPVFLCIVCGKAMYRKLSPFFFLLISRGSSFCLRENDKTDDRLPVHRGINGSLPSKELRFLILEGIYHKDRDV